MAKGKRHTEKPKVILELEEILGKQFLRGSDSHECSYDILGDESFELKLMGIDLRSKSNFFPTISGIENLQFLSFLSCKIESFEWIKNLKDLRMLQLIGSNVSSLQPFIEMTEMTLLNISGNDITNLESLEKIKCKTIFIANNKIKYVSKELAKEYKWLKGSLSFDFNLVLTGNPLEFPPPSIIQAGPDTVKNYYQMAEENGDSPLSEGRIIVVGDGSSGKSSLIERLMYNQFEEGKTQTNGISIENWSLTFDNRELTFHFWDFGGQEIQHAVHKFFFTEGCLYILVLDNRKEEDPEYWLQQIESLGGKAPVLVVFNKSDENLNEIADRKFLKEKYPNIVGFYKTSCKTGFGVLELKSDLEKEAIKLHTVHERLPNNWLNIKKELERLTSGEQHYFTYEVYQAICRANGAERDEVHRLLLKYFTTIGAVTWFGDTYLNFLHVLSPAWITQGVYKIITAQKTARLFGSISIVDFPELLYPVSTQDFTYREDHYGYLLSMMKKFDLCHTQDDKQILIPSAFEKEPKVEYSGFRGSGVRTYILQFRNYMPLAIIHRFISGNISSAFENNFWYSGIVLQDSKSNSLTMVHADKEAKRIYVRIKGEAPLGHWEHIRRLLFTIIDSYANIQYQELVAIGENEEGLVAYEDLISHLQAGKNHYFHPKLRKDFNVGYLMGLFEERERTIEKLKKGDIVFDEHMVGSARQKMQVPKIVLNILNNNTPQISTSVSTHIDLDINIQVVNKISSSLKGDASYLIEELKDSNSELKDALQKVVEFCEDARGAQSTDDVKEKGWGRKLKKVVSTISDYAGELKNIQDGREVVKSILDGLGKLTRELDLPAIGDLITKG